MEQSILKLLNNLSCKQSCKMYFKDIPEAAQRRPVRHLLQVPRCNFASVLE